MRPITLFASSLSGAAFAAALIIACSDDSPTGADAAVCDCPAAEPPLSGRIMTVVVPITIPANNRGGNAASCPTGATLLGGGCRNSSDDVRAVLINAGPNRIVPTQPGYSCDWISTAPTAVMAQAEAICLMPAQ